jgi:hypothetical protein
MNSRANVLIPFSLFVFLLHGQAQLWAPILGPSQAIDWTKSGVGGIPARSTNCAVLTSSATVALINSALASCHSGQTVYLSAGTYSISGSISIPSNVTLRGAGADQTILNATGTSGNVINLGTGSPAYSLPTISVTGGATAGSTSIAVSSTSGIHVGTLLGLADINDASYINPMGSEGLCIWCDGGWSSDGSYVRGQVVMVTGINGSTLTISPGLYSAYTNSPLVSPVLGAEQYAGVENLQVYANNTGYGANFSLSGCAYCWVKGVESNYTDGDHAQVYWGYHDEIRDSYFSNAYLHTPGTHDSDIHLALKTSASLVENNIIERTHASVLFESGPAGNVIAYNYTMGEFDSNANQVVIGGIDLHAPHPQFNLLEGNVVTYIYLDSVHGSSSQTTAFRNWSVGTNHICTPTSGSRVTVSCSGAIYGFQGARAMQISYLALYNNFIGNVLGSIQMQSLVTNYEYPHALTQTASVEYPSTRTDDANAYGWTFGYGEFNDAGPSDTGCSGGTPPCHLAGTSATDFFHGNYNNVNGSITWATGVTQTLPASFYLSSKPAWWGSMPFPATGPDVTGGTGPGGHSYGNPAQACYFNVMGGSDGGAGSPLTFNASACYGPPPPTGLTGTVH